jgi:tetratricopeptide (TPR) repeat protein
MAAVKPLAHLLAGLALVLIQSFAPVSAWAKKPQPPSTVADLRLGVALYEYYQNRPLDALSELLVAKARGGIVGHGNHPDIMEGGFYLGYGMQRTATQLFDRLLTEPQSAKTRDSAWFYLARLRYEQKDWAGVEAALTHVSKDPDWDLAQDILALRVNMATSQDNTANAARLAEQFERDSTWRAYAYYNLGAAFGRQGDFKKAVDNFDLLLHMRLERQEELALYDKAMTSAGYAYLLNKRYQEAIDQFAQVRLSSPVANRALLGYGWAAAESQNYSLALKPWTALSQRNLVDESAQEVLIALPYAYEKLGRKPEALAAYKQAENQYLSEINQLDGSLKALITPVLDDTLNLPIDEDLSWNRYAEDHELPAQKAYFAALFARNEFQQQVQVLRDLLQMRVVFSQWQNKMQLYQDLVDERDLSREAHMEHYQQHPYSQQVASLLAQRDMLTAQLQKAITSNDAEIIVSGPAANRYQTLQQAKANFSRLLARGQASAEQIEKLRFYSGLNLMDATERESANRYALEQNLKTVHQQLTQLSNTWQRTSLEAQTGVNFQSFRSRLGNARNRIDDQLKRTDRAIADNKIVLRAKIQDVLEFQRARLNQYLAQTRLSIARLLDEATGEKY